MRHLHALIIGTALSVPSLALAATPADVGQRPVAAHAATQQAVTSKAIPQQQAAAGAQKAATSDRARYAQKEAQSGEAQNYRGGDTLVIGAGAATAILAVILLIVLL
jgi:hypothetical protein